MLERSRQALQTSGSPLQGRSSDCVCFPWLSHLSRLHCYKYKRDSLPINCARVNSYGAVATRHWKRARSVFVKMNFGQFLHQSGNDMVQISSQCNCPPLSTPAQVVWMLENMVRYYQPLPKALFWLLVFPWLLSIWMEVYTKAMLKYRDYRLAIVADRTRAQ